MLIKKDFFIKQSTFNYDNIILIIILYNNVTKSDGDIRTKEKYTKRERVTTIKIFGDIIRKQQRKGEKEVKKINVPK